MSYLPPLSLLTPCLILHTQGSDLLGRTAAFNATLFLTSVFGVVASLANTFPLLCAALFLLGSAVGVSDTRLSIIALG